MFEKRYIHDYITADLAKKMVFMGGPRQVGKTTLAKNIATNSFTKATYLNWDSRSDRSRIIQERFPTASDLIIFDEIHKYRQWKNYIKGIFDTRHDRLSLLITGSARLDLYKKGGDSLMGRYHYYRLHPFSVAELLHRQAIAEPGQPLSFAEQITPNIFDDLYTFGGFPEPLFEKNERTLRRWHRERLDRLVREDIRDIELVRDISALEILTDVLPRTVSSRLSLNSLREDFGVAHKTIASWVDILERFYYHFRIYPWAARHIQALRKEPKLYLWDWSQVSDPAARLENMVAAHLLKFVHFLVDVHGYAAQLHYLRDTQGHEVDFLVCVGKQPWFAVEVKHTDDHPAKHLHYFAERIKIPLLFQVIRTRGVDDQIGNVRVMSVEKFCSGLV